MDQQILDTIINLVKVLGAVGLGSGVMPLIIAAINRPEYPSAAKQTVAVMTSILVAIVGIIWSGIDYRNLAIVLPALLIGTHMAYIKYWKSTGIASWLEQLLSHNRV